MKHAVKVIFGKEQVNKFHNDEPFTKDELKLNIKEYFFETEIESVAFCKGIEETVGWMECSICKEV